MPAAADRLFTPRPEPAPRRPLLAALAVTASVAVHGAAVAAAIGFWGDDTAVPPRPFEVVMVTVTRPSPAPAPDAPGDWPGPPAPAQAETGGPPTVAMPVAESVAPSVRAQLPATSQPVAPPTRSTPPPIPERITAAAITPPPALVAEAGIKVAPIERVETPPAARAAPVPTDPPRPVARPAMPPATARPPGRQMAALPPVRPAAGDKAAPAARAPSPVSTPGGGGSPAEFSLGSAGNPAPDYPFRARQRGWEGRVVLRVEVDRQGHPVRVDVAESSGHGVLDQAAHRTIASWVFRPATRGGRAVAGETLVPIVFRLN